MNLSLGEKKSHDYHGRYLNRRLIKDAQPEEFDLVILAGGTGSTVAAWTFAGEGKRVAVLATETDDPYQMFNGQAS